MDAISSGGEGGFRELADLSVAYYTAEGCTDDFPFAAIDSILYCLTKYPVLQPINQIIVGGSAST
jgi:hypothetical protein